MKALFDNLCPNCEGEINDIRLAKKLPCEVCLPEEVQEETFEGLVFRVYEELKKKGKLGKYRTIYEVVWRLQDFNAFFHRLTGSKLWSAQRTWAKRIFLGRSFSIIAPTGIGKTVFGASMALYLANHGEKVYFVLPTTTLLLQVKKRMDAFAKRAGLDLSVLAIHGKLSKKKKEEALERLKKGDFSVLLTTAQFLARNFEDMKGLRFDFVFVDDVDAFLKASKNIERILVLLGFSEEIIGVAYELIRAKLAMIRNPSNELAEKISRLQEKIEKYRENNPIGQLIVASATGRARGLRVKLFRELLEFEVGSTRAQLRNVVNAYAEPKDVKGAVYQLVRMLGTGGIIFVPLDQGQAFAEELERYLKERGIRCAFARSENAVKVLESFAKGEIDVAIGMAAYYGTLVRGIDLPERVRYVVFTGVPKFKFTLTLEGAPPGRIAFLLDAVSEIVEERRGELRALANRIRRYAREEDVERGRSVLSELLTRKEVLEKLAERPDITVREEGGTTYIIIPDAKTYIQASGRCSRMFAGGITKGLSVVLVDDEKVFKQLERHLRIVYGETFVHFGELNVKELLEEIDRDRRRVREAGKFEDPVKTVLFVVESPNKARTIASFFGRPSVYRMGGIRGYEVSTGKYLLTVMATRGHMFDLVVDRGFHGVLVGERFVPVYTTIKVCRRCGTQTTAPVCPKCGTDEYLEDAIWRVNALRLFALESDYVIIGTDPDTEGEKIAWDTYLAISPLVPKIHRAEFHEVTKQAILRALEEVRNIDENRVNAQIVRRVEDRWIGFELSQKLWKVFNNRALSAGRVQTPVLGWIIDRYKEHRENVAVFLSVTYEKGRVTFETPFSSEREAESFAVGKKLTVRLEGREEKDVTPPPPFTTDTMLREAGRVLGLGAREIMDLAQDLFEMGLITYHRTDSTHVSSTGIQLAKEYVTERFGEDYFEGRRWGEEGAHECIRPTRPLDVDQLIEYIREGEINVQGLTKNHLRLYGLIFRRFMASQMKAARVERAKVVYELDGLRAEEERVLRVIFPGWYAIWGIESEPVEEGEYAVEGARAFHASKVPLYTQADVVALMKERGIGRPSTYATIIQKLLDRRYVIETRGRKKLVPTPLGVRVYTYLSEKFGPLISEERTRELEEIMDAIERGEKDYQEALGELYQEILSVKDIF